MKIKTEHPHSWNPAKSRGSLTSVDTTVTQQLRLRLFSVLTCLCFCFTASVLVPRPNMWEVSAWILQRRAGERLHTNLRLSLSLCQSCRLLFTCPFLPNRKRSSWTARSSSRCCGARVPWRTATSRSSRSTPSSTWRSGSCASSHALYPGPVCCACGTCSSVKVALTVTPQSVFNGLVYHPKK